MIKIKKINIYIFVSLFMVLLLNNFTYVSAASINNTFSYTYLGQTYESNVSQDDAWDTAMKTQLDLGNITMDDVIEDYVVFGSRDIIEEEDEIQTYSWTPVLSGSAQWQPNTNSAYLPLQGVKVELYFHFSNYLPIKIDEVYTDDNGCFKFDDYDNWYYIISSLGITIYNGIAQKFTVRIYPSGETFRVSKDWAASSLVETFDGLASGIFPNDFGYFVSSTVRTWVWESSGSFGTIKIPYSTDNDAHKSFYISQALLMGQRFATDVCGFDLNNQVIALYPFKNFDRCFCWHNFMAIGTQLTGTQSPKDYFDDWETIIHEYGHFLQWNLNINNIGLLNEYLIYWPEHESDNNHMAPVLNDGKGNKLYGAKLAWTEAWATVYSLITVDYYQYGYYQDNQYLGGNGASILNCVDDLLEYKNFINSLSVYDSAKQQNMCEGQEDAIILFMFELYKKEFYGLSGFLNTATIEETYIFSDYAQNLYNAYPTYINEIGVLMGEYQIAPKNFSVKNINDVNYNVSPKVSWTPNGSQDNMLDQVEFHFLNENGELIYKTSQVQVNGTYNNTFTYTLPINEWKQALNSLEDKTIFLSVVGYNSDAPITGGYYSNIIEINIDFPVFFYSLNHEGTSYILSDVWNIENLFELTIDETFNNKQITEIADNIFMNALNLEYVEIPETIDCIGSNAFKNCINLTKVIINKEVDGITDLGDDVYGNCLSLEEIRVPQNRIGEYKNALNWNEYKDVIIPNVDAYNVFEIDCYTDFVVFINLSKNERKIYKLSVTCSNLYNIILEYDILFEANLYDSNFNIIYASNDSIDAQLIEGTYYIDFLSLEEQSYGSIKFKIYENNYQDISLGNSNINDHIHFSENTYIKRVKLSNVNVEGFYIISLTGYNDNNELIELSAGAMNIYNSSNRNQVMDMYPVINEHTKAQNIDGANGMIVYFPVNQTFYINLILPTNNLQSLYLSITPVEEENINLFNCSTSDEEIVFRIDGCFLGSSIQKINIKQAGTFEVVRQGFTEGLLVILRQLTIEDGNIIWDSNIVVDITDLEDNIFNLNEGTYYIGYANANLNQYSSFKVVRKVAQYGNTNLYHYSGTEVTVNGGSEYTNTITQGFTRLIFLTSGESRLDYYWYTSNETVSRITEAGTLMALAVNNDTNIQIMAVNKLDYSKVYVKDYVIKKETKEMDDAPLMYNYEMVISPGIDNIVQIDLSTKNIPINWLQYYIWTSTSDYLNVDQFGRVYASEEAVGTTCAIMGQYKLNERVLVYISITVI